MRMATEPGRSFSAISYRWIDSSYINWSEYRLASARRSSASIAIDASGASERKRAREPTGCSAIEPDIISTMQKALAIVLSALAFLSVAADRPGLDGFLLALPCYE